MQTLRIRSEDREVLGALVACQGIVTRTTDNLDYLQRWSLSAVALRGLRMGWTMELVKEER